MWKWISLVIGAVLIFAGVMVGDSSGASQATASPRPAAPAQVDVDTPDDSLLRWPLPLGAEKYAAIDGKRMHRDVVAQALISRRYRDRVHPKFKGTRDVYRIGRGKRPEVYDLFFERPQTKAQTSALRSSTFPRACSRLIYEAVPRMAPGKMTK